MESIKFKVGDRVRVIEHESNYAGIPLGSLGTVADMDVIPLVVMDDESLNTEEDEDLEIKGLCFIQEELELVEDPKP